MSKVPHTFAQALEMFDGFIVTGTLVNGRRFKFSYASNISSLRHAMGINLWRGSVWGVTDKKRTLIKRVWN